MGIEPLKPYGYMCWKCLAVFWGATEDDAENLLIEHENNSCPQIAFELEQIASNFEEWSNYYGE